MSENNSRRTFLKAGAAGGALAAVAGYSETLHKLVKGAWSGEQPAHPLYGNAPEPEFSVDPASGALTPNPKQTVSYTMCMGCTTVCGVRVRVDNQSGRVLRVTGNPYHPLGADPFLPYDTSVGDSFVTMSRHRDQGLAGRATACGRGNAILEMLDAPHRVRTPLKRVGPRNGGQWVPISFEQLVKEVVEGGDLFGEGHVDGLRALRDLETPLDPQQPEMGARVNQVGVLTAFNDGRQAFAKRFAKQSYGTLNFGAHGTYCGASMRAGYGTLLGDHRKYSHLKPDYANTEFALFIGTSPSQAGNPFKRQGGQLAQARSDGGLHYALVDPVLTNASSLASGDRSRWVAVKPGTDGALVMGMIRWILENRRYDANFLAQPGPKAAKAAGEPSWSNATHLVIVEPGHPREGHMLRGSDLGLEAEPSGDAPTPAGNDRYSETDPYIVMETASGRPVAHTKAGPAMLFFAGMLKIDGKPATVKTSLTLLREEALRHQPAAYSEICGVPVETITALAKEFTGHGKRAVADTHGGTMATNGFYNAWAIVMLNALIGNLNWKGGTSAGGGKFPAEGKGPRYNLASFPGAVKPKGVPLGRNKFPYEKTTEFKRKAARGKPYPSEAPWYPLSPVTATEWFTSSFNGYPYSLKALILWMANPIYGHAGLRSQIEKDLTDVKKLPLVVAIDPFINETNSFADYIVPDSVLYENWGWATPWGGVPTRATTARWPVVTPRQDKHANGDPIGMESFFIAVAKRLGLPGFGERAIPAVAAQGAPGADTAKAALHPLERPQDFYLRGAANVAFAGAQPVPDASDEDIRLAGVTRILPELKTALSEDEWRKAAYVYARGGRFQNYTDTYEGEWLTNRYNKPMLIYSEAVATARNTLSGERYTGVPTWMPPTFADGTPIEAVYPASDWPLLAISHKSALQNSYSIGASSLRQIHPTNPVAVNKQDAARLGISSGDAVRIVTPGGAVTGTALVREGVRPGVIAIEHGFGHRELGARQHRIGKHRQDAPEGLHAGVNLNDLGLADARRPGLSTLGDRVLGTAARQALPARLEKA